MKAGYVWLIMVAFMHAAPLPSLEDAEGTPSMDLSMPIFYSTSDFCAAARPGYDSDDVTIYDRQGVPFFEFDCTNGFFPVGKFRMHCPSDASYLSLQPNPSLGAADRQTGRCTPDPWVPGPPSSSVSSGSSRFSGTRHYQAAPRQNSAAQPIHSQTAPLHAGSSFHSPTAVGSTTVSAGLTGCINSPAITADHNLQAYITAIDDIKFAIASHIKWYEIHPIINYIGRADNTDYSSIKNARTGSVIRICVNAPAGRENIKLHLLPGSFYSQT